MNTRPKTLATSSFNTSSFNTSTFKGTSGLANRETRVGTVGATKQVDRSAVIGGSQNYSLRTSKLVGGNSNVYTSQTHGRTLGTSSLAGRNPFN